MKLDLEDYVDPKFDPGGKFESETVVGDETIDSAILDPAVFVGTIGKGKTALSRELTRMATRDVLRQQQYLLFGVGQSVGILSSFVEKARKSLGYVDINIPVLDANRIEGTVLETAIGVAAGALSAVPNIYAQIVAAVLNFGVGLAHWAIDLAGGNTTSAKLITPLLPMPQYRTQTDQDVFNNQVMSVVRSGSDWTSIFMPRYRGSLTGVTRVNRAGQRSIGWALGDGELPKVHWDGKGTSKDPGTWTITDGEYVPFYSNLGIPNLGFIPGGERIYGIVQTTALYDQIGPYKSHPSVYNRNCAGIEQADRTDTGIFYPTTNQGVVSLWDWIAKLGPSMYTLDANALISAWDKYFYEIFRGVIGAWRNPEWEAGWGCSFWKAALMNLVQNYTVVPGLPIGVVSWTPNSNDELTTADLDAWNEWNVLNQIIRPALKKLLKAQLTYLSTTTIAAYLPIYGGVDADPMHQDTVMGAMKNDALARVFVEMRRSILEGPLKYEVRLEDVVDAKYRKQLQDYGGGTKGLGMPKLSAREPVNVPTPTGGSGFASAAGLLQRKRASKYLIAGGAAVTATALGYFFWDDLARLLSQAVEKLPANVRRRLP